MNTGNGKRQNSTFSPTQTSAGSPPPPGYRPGGVAGDPTALPFRPQTPPGRRLPATAPTAGPAAMLGAAGQTPRASPPPLPPGALRGLCAWLDGLPLSRPKRHLARDFSDGVMLAEIVKHFRPHLVDLHNYVPTCNTDQKLSNWSILNRQASRLPACPVGAPALLCEDPALKAGLGGRPLPYPPGLWDKLSGCFPVRVCPPVPWGLPISTDSQGLPAKRTWPAPVSHSAGRQSGSC